MVRRIAIVEDERQLATSIAARLESEGFAAEIATDGPSGVELCRSSRPDLVILDLMLPGLDGLEVCRQIQAQRPVPVLMLTARDDEADIEVGLAVGADDYLTKPFSPRELVARVRAILRRADRASVAHGEAVHLGALVVDPATRTITLGGAPVHLTQTEFDLVLHLARTPNVVYGRRRLLEEVWGYRVGAGERTVDSHIRSIRRKLDAGLIRTVHGVGYALDPSAIAT